MLSIEECKKHLKASYSDDAILQIRENLYCLANILVENYCVEREDGSKQSMDQSC
jgi:hypothetical protein